MKPRIAFDLDETLGVPIIQGSEIVGFQIRQGCIELLQRLNSSHVLCLWSVSSRRYVDQVLSFGLGEYFREVYTWDEIQASWKDARKLELEMLIDDSPHHREFAEKQGLENKYLVVPAYGSPEDNADPMLWVSMIQGVLLKGHVNAER